MRRRRMIQIIVDNSYSKVTGLSVKQEKELKEVLSYTTGSFFSRFGPTKKSMLNKRGEFPTGLLPKVEGYLSKLGYARKDLRKAPKIIFNGFEMSGTYPAQIAASEAALIHGQGIISMPTGSGKSRVIKMIAAALNLKTLIIVPSLEIKRQLSETLQDLQNVTVENIDSKALKTLTGFDCLIIDECHHAAAKTYQKLNKTAWKGIYYRFCLSASPFRNNDEETLLFEGIAGQVI